MFGAFLLGGGYVFVSLFAVALAGCGLLTTVGVIVAMDTFGPVSDNAQGIAEMSGDIDERGARVLTDLDAVGNTTKAITKGIAIATAVLAATALFGSFGRSFVEALTDTKGALNTNTSGGTVTNFGSVYNLINASKLEKLSFSFDISQPNTLFGVIIGAAVVFFFSGLAINAVGPAQPAGWCSRCGRSSATTPGSWTTANARTTAASSTSAPRTRCASSRRPVCWRSWLRSRSASCSASDRWPAISPGRSAPGC